MGVSFFKKNFFSFYLAQKTFFRCVGRDSLAYPIFPRKQMTTGRGVSGGDRRGGRWLSLTVELSILRKLACDGAIGVAQTSCVRRRLQEKTAKIGVLFSLLLYSARNYEYYR